MKETRFIEAVTAEDLTKEVQKAEGDGWVYVQSQVAFGQDRFAKVFVAVMQRENKQTKSGGVKLSSEAVTLK